MDFIFEEDMDDVGSDLDAYCPKCKADTAHTVISKYEDEVRKVQCSTCGDVHAFRKPRGEVEEEAPEPVSAKRRLQHRKPTWQEARDKAGNKATNNARPYSIRERYKEGDVVQHPKFGIGFVTEITENKAEVTFQDERRVLVHNRPELAAQMPAIAPVVPPREDKGRGKGRGKGAAPAAKGAKGKAPEPPPPPAPPPVVAKGKPVEVAPGQGKKGKEKAAPPPPPPVAKGKESKAERAKAAVVKKQAAAGKPAAKAKPAAKPAPAKKAAPPPRPVAKGKPAAKAKPAKRAGKR